MKKIRFLGLLVLFWVLGAALFVFASALWTDDNPTGDLTQNVEVSAAAGTLKFHARNETQYRNMNSGTQSLTSGSFLKTGNGSADILLPDNSVLSLDANTEVQVGMYHDGTVIVQQSGRAYHCVEPQAGAGYAVRTPYFTATAVGTEYRTIVNFPVEGAVTVEWGEVDVVSTQRDLRSGQNTRDVYGFVPQGHKVIWPLDPGVTDRLLTGEYENFRASADRPGVVGQKSTPPAADAWTRRTRNLGQLMRNLRQRHARGLLNDSQYLQKLRDLIGVGPGVMPERPSPPMGGLWVGMGGEIMLIKFCVSGNTISGIHIVDVWDAQDKQTGENSQLRVNFSLPRGVQFSIGEGGRVYDYFTIEEEGLWKGATVIFNGHIGSTTGRILVDNYSETDVARYWGHCMTIDIHLIDPNGCNY
jgi:hypothetical protein